MLTGSRTGTRSRRLVGTLSARLVQLALTPYLFLQDLPNNMKQLFKQFTVVFLLGLAAAGSAFAQAPVDGKEYTSLTAAQPTEKGKVEVLEFFWYACPHCYALEPQLERWIKQLPKDVTYRRVPVAFQDSSIPHSRMFYTLEGLGKLEALHMKAFNAIHLEKNRMTTAETQADYFAKEGVDRKAYLDMYNSFSVQTKVRAAQQAWQNYKIEGTPALAIGGRFLTSPSQAGGHASVTQVADFLIDKARKEQGRSTQAKN